MRWHCYIVVPVQVCSPDRGPDGKERGGEGEHQDSFGDPQLRADSKLVLAQPQASVDWACRGEVDCPGQKALGQDSRYWVQDKLAFQRPSSPDLEGGAPRRDADCNHIQHQPEHRQVGLAEPHSAGQTGSLHLQIDSAQLRPWLPLETADKDRSLHEG